MLPTEKINHYNISLTSILKMWKHEQQWYEGFMSLTGCDVISDLQDFHWDQWNFITSKTNKYLFLFLYPSQIIFSHWRKGKGGFLLTLNVIQVLYAWGKKEGWNQIKLHTIKSENESALVLQFYSQHIAWDMHTVQGHSADWFAVSYVWRQDISAVFY